jgi:hypothetical protein
MKELIKIINQGSDLMADSRDIAKLFGVEHQHLRETIESNEAHLSQLGHLQFQTGDGIHRPQGGGKQEKFIFLNFDQIALLLTLTRTTEQTKEFRVKLIIAFRDARNKLRPVDHALLSIPAEWRKTFPDDFYIALLHLYGDEFEKSGDTPSWVGRWTNRFIYEPLFEGLPNELKGRRHKHTGNPLNDAFKLHQFIEKHAKKNLEKHLVRVTTLLSASTSRSHFVELFASVFYGRKQLLLGDNNQPDEFA